MNGSTYQEHPEMAPEVDAFDAGHAVGHVAKDAAKVAVVTGEVVVGVPVVVGEAAVGATEAVVGGVLGGLGSFISGVEHGAE
jgi:hypothetical protein